MDTKRSVIAAKHVLGNIKAELARQDLRHGDLAEVLEVTPATISMKLRGVRPLTLEELTSIADRLNVDASYLFDFHQSQRSFHVEAV